MQGFESRVALIHYGFGSFVEFIELGLKDTWSQFGKDRKAKWSHTCMELKDT